jgi:predicted DCC family thiol-disulfide oxidoreductase YuxK
MYEAGEVQGKLHMKNGKAINGTMKKTTLIYDSACPVCSRTVQWIGENEVENSFEMLPCRSEALDVRFPGMDRAACARAMQLVLPDGAVLSGEKALPEIFKRLRRYKSIAILFRLPGAAMLSRILYRWFADRRYRIADFFHISLPKK